MKNKGLWLALTVIGLLFLVWPREGQPPQPPPMEKLRLATSFSMFSTLVFVAHEQGYFKDAGLDVTLDRQESGRAALQAVVQNNAELATVSEYPVVNAILNGETLRIVGSIASSSRHSALIARKDRGIQSLADLRGKKVGVPLGATAEFLLEAMLTLNQVPLDGIEKVNLSAKEIVEAIMAGRVDAICVWNPYGLTARQRLGNNHVVFYGDGIYRETFSLVAHHDTVGHHPERIEKVLRALESAAQSIRSRPELAHAALRKNIELNQEEIEELWEGYDFVLTLEQALLTTLESQASWMIRRKADSKIAMPNFLNILYLNGMKRVKPEAITVIQ